MTTPIENCQKYTAEQVEAMGRNLEIVSASTLQPEIKDMLRAYAATLRQQGEKAGGVVSDEVIWMFKGSDNKWHTFDNDMHRDNTIEDDRWDVRQFAPLLRAPAEQGGRVDDVILREAADEALTLLQQLDPQHGITTQLQATLAQNTLAQQVIDGKAQWDDLAGILGADGDNVDDVFAKAKSLTQNTQVGAVLEIGECAEVIWHQGGPCQLPPGAKLYLHAERARVPPEVAAWVDAKREHKRLVVVYNDRLAYAKQHDLGRVSVDHEYQAMCAQQRVMDALIEPMFAAFAAAPSQPEDEA